MASGKTHDQITLACLPTVWLLCRWLFHLPLPESALITFGTFAGGFFLSPDLDTRSRPFYRWGPLRFIWWPYQWAIRHRSPLSHGLFLASCLRLVYLTAILSVLYAGLSFWLGKAGIAVNPQPGKQVLALLQAHLGDILYFGIGLWLGAFIHISLDWLSSGFQSRKKRR